MSPLCHHHSHNAEYLSQTQATIEIEFKHFNLEKSGI